MAPGTHSGKRLTVEEVSAHKRALSSGPVNTTGLPALPTELLLEIVSHFPTVKFPCYATRPFDETYLLRGQLIRALSQMCRSLRCVFLPLAYERIEVCALQKQPRQTNPQRRASGYRARSPNHQAQEKAMATELVRQLEVVTIRDPSLAQYVKIINIMFTSYSKETVIGEFFRCLPLFPNVHTIQIFKSLPRPIGFEQFKLPQQQFPSVQRFSAACYTAFEIIKLFPNARHIGAGPGISLDFFKKLDASDLAQSWSNIVDLRGLENIANWMLWDHLPFFPLVINKLPKLQVMRFGIGEFCGTDLRVDQVKLAARFQHLRSIIFHFNAPIERAPPTTSTLPPYHLEGPIITPQLTTPTNIELFVTAFRVLQAKPEKLGFVRYLSVLSLEGDTLLRLQVNKNGYVCEVDTEGLLRLMKENHGELTLAD